MTEKEREIEALWKEFIELHRIERGYGVTGGNFFVFVYRKRKGIA